MKPVLGRVQRLDITSFIETMQTDENFDSDRAEAGG